MKKRILFIGHTAQNDRPFLDPSTRYRCYTPASALRRRGHHTAVMSQKHFEESEHITKEFEYFVFHRPVITEKLAPFLEVRKNGPTIIADFDDFIFDVSKSHLTPAHRFRGQPISNIAKYIANIAAACRYFNRFSASTYPLTEKMKELFGATQAVVTSNSLEPGYSGIASLIREHMRAKDRPYKFGYFSGTATHDADFESVAPSIVEAFERFPDARMLVLGPTSIPQALMPHRVRIDHRTSVVPFYQLPHVMAQVETVIAPLEWNDFTICKSGLKFFEAALVGCSVVATPIPDIDRFDSPMLRKCTSSEEWTSALTTPFEIPEEEIEGEISKTLQMVDSEIIAEIWEKEFFR